MAQYMEYFGLYRNSQLRCDVTPTSRIAELTNSTKELSNSINELSNWIWELSNWIVELSNLIQSSLYV